MYNLILVGGTGKQFGIVLGWLNQLGLIKPPSKLLVVDADISGYDRVVRGLSYANPNFTATHVRPYNSSMASLSMLSEMQLSKDTSPLLDLTFTEDEQNLNIKDGFFGNPKIGATVFGFNQQHASQNHSMVSSLIQSGGHIQNPTVIAGSVSGGTGAGLIYSIAKICASKRLNAQDAPVIGIVFSKYTTVEENNPLITNAKLQDNSFNGINFLWNKYSQNQSDFAFDLVNVMGPPYSDNHPQFTVPAVTNGEVAPYPGYLIAAQLFTDGLEKIHQDIRSSIVASQRALGISTFSGRMMPNTSHYVHSRDITFDVINSSANQIKLSASEFGQYLKALRTVLEEIINFPIDNVLGNFSIFPLRKLPPALVEYLLAQNAKNQISKNTLIKTFEELKHCASSLIDNLLENPNSSFSNWFQSLSGYGLDIEALSETAKIEFSSWLDSTPKVNIQVLTQGINIAVDLMLKGICTNQVHNYNTALNPLPDGQNIWLLPYLSQPLPPSLGHQILDVDLHRINVQNLSANSGACYPTALGKIESFGQQLLGALSTNDFHAEAYQEAERLWCGLAMGIIKIKPIKVKQLNISNLEKLVGSFEGLEVLSLLEDSQGNIIGGCHPEYGLWSGIKGTTDQQELMHVIFDNMRKNKAKSVLKTWLEDINQVSAEHDYINLNGRTWYRFLSQFLSDASMLAPEERDFDLGAHAPIELNVTRSNGDTIKQCFYPYFSSPYRKLLREHLISNIAQPTNKLSLIYQNGMLDIIHPILQKIASIYVGSNPFVAANNLRIALTEGCLTPVISSNYPLDVLEALSTTPLLGMINKLADRNGIQLLNAYQDAQGKPRILKPELLW